MIAYNHSWLNNLLVREQAEKAINAHCISKEEKEQVYAAYPAGFYSPNIFVRTGLFILTMIVVQFTLGLVSLMIFTAVKSEHLGILFIFFGLLVYGGLEFMVKKNHYKSGVDDALMWMAAGSVVGGLNALTSVSWLANAMIIFILALFLFLRFTNALMAAIASMAFIVIVFLSFIKLGAIAKAVTPFLVMAIAAGIYIFVKKLLNKASYPHYEPGLLIVSIVALVCFYAAGNYFAVREASVAMFNLDLKENESIPLGWLFWLFTIAIPIVYIIRGIQKKDAVLLRVGLLLIAAVVFTIRYYYHVLPPETAMVIGGILFIGFAWFLTKYLQAPKHGFTYQEQDEKFFMDKLQVESLIIAQTFSGPALPANTGTAFGGGTGEGGGASGQF